MSNPWVPCGTHSQFEAQCYRIYLQFKDFESFLAARIWSKTIIPPVFFFFNSSSFRGQLLYIVESLRWTGECIQYCYFEQWYVAVLGYFSGRLVVSMPVWLLSWHLSSVNSILSQVKFSALGLQAFRILSILGMDPAPRDRLSLTQVTRDWCINQSAGIILHWEPWASVWSKYLGQYDEHILSLLAAFLGEWN